MTKKQKAYLLKKLNYCQKVIAVETKSVRAEYEGQINGIISTLDVFGYSAFLKNGAWEIVEKDIIK